MTSPPEHSIESVATRLAQRRRTLDAATAGAGDEALRTSTFPRSLTMRTLVAHPGFGLAVGAAVVAIGPRRLLGWAVRALSASGWFDR